ncbi:MAG: MOSC domain-containing protein [Myxococcota bacterium]|nr:MOSC domain-containing protein [Myxococcota bacterium]
MKATSFPYDASLDEIRRAPKQAGRIELVARRPRAGEREVVEHAMLDIELGLVGDSWSKRPHRKLGRPHPDGQITLMSSRAIAAIVPDRAAWALAGDQLFVDLDLSPANLPPGTRLAVGTAVLEVTAEPHLGCVKFTKRFGSDATKWVNTPTGKQLNLRGINAKVVVAGEVRPGDEIRKL